jgi:hypothetical protein
LVLAQVLGTSCSARTRICPPAASFLAVAHLLSCLGEELICLSLVLVPDTRRSLDRLALNCPPARAHSSGADLSFAEQGACLVFLLFGGTALFSCLVLRLWLLVRQVFAFLTPGVDRSVDPVCFPTESDWLGPFTAGFFISCSSERQPRVCYRVSS